ncbi:preprotein translocase subunit YajC [Flexibacter flexilis DSM 6793]|uniref:Sec translocon accessory complex subunit YajC n=1 Tax=Flexibacter flexilis DSM 6793 TaxID=927664 RepID=A0A1I1GVW4_9BACT|nr:preprotein translocase subunit YajC [Flexibacter flexilis]SFC13313.1 preprotein translocase subunit YajC [Flexibacter flexilis DSM 6793]
MNLQFILAQAQQGGSLVQTLILFGLMGIVFYFFMFRPQQKKSKEQKDFLASLQKGADVVTIGGLHGKVASVEETSVTIEVDKGVKLKFEKSAISVESSKRTKV